MAKTTNEKIMEAKAEKQKLQNRINILTQQQKKEERKARTKRLCERAGYMESILPDTIPLSDEQFKIFLNKTLLTSFSYDRLAEAKTMPAAPEKPKQTEQPVKPEPAKPAEPPRVADGGRTGDAATFGD